MIQYILYLINFLLEYFVNEKGLINSLFKYDISPKDLTLFSMGYFKNTTVWGGGGGIMAPSCNFSAS